MSVPLETIESVFTDYRRDCEAYRDEQASPESRAAAGDSMLANRHKLDELLIEDKRQREEEERMAMLEARRAVEKTVAQIQPQDRAGNLPIEDIRSFANRERPMCEFKVPIPQVAIERAQSGRSIQYRTEYDVSTAASGAYGSYLVPQTWADYVITEEVAASGVMSAGPTIVRTAMGGQMNFPKLSTDIAAAAGTEGSDATQDTPIFTTVPFNSYRIDGYIIVTEEMLRDTEIDLNSYLGALAGRALGTKMAAYLADEDIGTGSSAPAAITVGATNGKTCASTSVVTFDEAKELFYSVLPIYRRGGSWIANSAQTLAWAQLKDGQGNYVWEPRNMASAPEVLWGKPFFEDAYFDASATGNKIVGFGDVRRAYQVRFVGPIEIGFSRDVNFKSFEVVMRYAQWFDAATIDSIAFKVATLA